MKPTAGEPPVLANPNGTLLPGGETKPMLADIPLSQEGVLESVELIPVARLLSVGPSPLPEARETRDAIRFQDAKVAQAETAMPETVKSEVAMPEALKPEAGISESLIPKAPNLEISIGEVPPLLPVEADKTPMLKRGLGWWLRLPQRAAYFLFQLASLILLLAVASSLPIVQLAGLGYMLEVGRRISDRSKKESILPGLAQATRIGVIAAGAYLTWLPVWLVSDYAYSANLIEVDSQTAQNWRIAAWILSVMWITHVAWAMLRGGRWYHFLWPAPLRFAREIFRPSTWRRAEDGLWQYTVGLKLPSLMWLGLRGAIGGLAWLTIPATFMLIGVTANNQPGRILLGIIGFALMTVVLMYLPFLQVQMARENRFLSIFDVRSVRQDFKRAPWAFFLAFFVTLAVALPLYFFRIESLPQELLWIPCLFFVALTLPARMLVGWALQRGHREIPKRLWISRWVAWTLQLASVPFYVFFLYLAMLTSWDGALIFFVQHAFLVPVPFSGT